MFNLMKRLVFFAMIWMKILWTLCDESLLHLKAKSEWKRTATFQTYFKQEKNICKVIINNGSCMNFMSSVINNINFKT